MKRGPFAPRRLEPIAEFFSAPKSVKESVNAVRLMVAPRSSACRRADGPSMPVSVRQQRAIDDTRALVRWIVSTNEQGITSQGMLARAIGWSAPQFTFYIALRFETVRWPGSGSRSVNDKLA